jgi:thioredoxin reductase
MERELLVNTFMQRVDVAVVGGGPAGLNAALVLGRCRRSVLLFDHGRYRNAASRTMHGFLSRDGASPVELRRIAREELRRYPSVAICESEVVGAQRAQRSFELHTRDGQVVHCRKLLLATGVVDEAPSVPGVRELLGVSVFHCPYCDGWELRDQSLVAYAHGDTGARFALGLTVWSPQVVLCTDGGDLPAPDMRERLARHHIALRSEPLERVSGDASHVELLFRNGSSLPARALFYSLGCRPGSDLMHQLGAPSLQGRSNVLVGRREETSVHGLYVAGDASRDALQAVVAAGEGSNAAVAINSELTREDLWEDCP